MAVSASASRWIAGSNPIVRLQQLDVDDLADVICHERVGSLETISESTYNLIVTARLAYLRGESTLEDYRLQRRNLLAAANE